MEVKEMINDTHLVVIGYQMDRIAAILKSKQGWQGLKQAI